MTPDYLRQLVLNQAIADIDCTDVERERFRDQFQNDATYRVWLRQQGITADQFEVWFERELKIRKFQQLRWGRTLYSYFLDRKRELDQVICSLIYLREMQLGRELYFRIVEGEQSFDAIARHYSQGQAAEEGGRVGPITLGELPSSLARLFYGGHPGQLWFPMELDGWVVIARLEDVLPARLDGTMRQQLLNELLEHWLHDQINQQFPAS